jgi:hypothetical protein
MEHIQMAFGIIAIIVLDPFNGDMNKYSIPSPNIVRASLVRCPSVVRGFERQNFSSQILKIASK